MFNLENLVGGLQNELAENEEITQENSEKNEEKKQEKKVKKAKNTAFAPENSQNNISEKKEEKNPQENEEKNGEKISDNAVDDDEDGENGNHSDGNVIIENDQDDDDDEDDYDDSDDDDDDDIDGEIPEGEDPLKGFAQDPNKEPEKVKVEEVIPPTSPKNLKNIEKLGKVALARVDVMKAKACANLSGQHMAEYLADEEMMDALLDAIKEYINSMEYKAPTPFGTLIITILLWGVPSFGLALWHKYSMPKPTQTPAQETTSTNFNQDAPNKSDYSHLKEFQDGRKVFATNKQKGTYNTTANGTFVKVEHADEYPAPIILQWLNEGLTNKEIREKLYGK